METVKDKIIKILKDRKVKFERIPHKPVFTMDEAKKACGHQREEGVKTLLLKSKEDLVLAVIRGDHKLDFRLARELLGVKKVSMASKDDLRRINAVEGGLSPFGYNQPLLVLLDESITEVDYCYINPGINTETFKLRAKDLVEIINSWAKKVVRS